MNKKVLLTEFYELTNDSSLLTEDEKRRLEEGEEITLAGVMQRAEMENGNGRIYPQPVLAREIENYKKLVEESRALGELDHPDSSVVELKNASHLVTYIEMRGNDVMGKVKILDTPSGKILKDLITSGVKLGISSRGLGSLKEKSGKKYVQDDYQLICFDMVSEPSTPNAFMMSEAKSYAELTHKDRVNRALNEVFREKDE